MSRDDDRHDPLDDDRVLAVVAAAFDEIEPTPPAAVDAALAAFGFRDLDALLADLVTDSWDPERSLALRAEPSDVRFLGFRRDGVSLDVELHPDGTLVGQLLADEPEAAAEEGMSAAPSPSPVAVVEVESRAGEIRALDVDPRGRFRAAAPARVLRLRCAGRLVTPWISW